MKPRVTSEVKTVTVMPESNEWHAAVSPVPERFSGTTEMHSASIVEDALGSTSEPVLETEDDQQHGDESVLV